MRSSLPPEHLPLIQRKNAIYTQTDFFSIIWMRFFIIFCICANKPPLLRFLFGHFFKTTGTIILIQRAWLCFGCHSFLWVSSPFCRCFQIGLYFSFSALFSTQSPMLPIHKIWALNRFLCMQWSNNYNSISSTVQHYFCTTIFHTRFGWVVGGRIGGVWLVGKKKNQLW